MFLFLCNYSWNAELLAKFFATGEGRQVIIFSVAKSLLRVMVAADCSDDAVIITS